MGKYEPAHHPLVLQPCDCFDFSSSPLLQNKDPGGGAGSISRGWRLVGLEIRGWRWVGLGICKVRGVGSGSCVLGPVFQK